LGCGSATLRPIYGVEKGDEKRASIRAADHLRKLSETPKRREKYFMMTSRKRGAVMLCALLIFMMTSAWTQPLPDRRPLNGHVLRPDGTPVAGATVTLQRENDLGSFAFWGANTVTDKQGRFSFADTEEDNYFLSVEAAGYSPLQSRSFTLSSTSGEARLMMQQLMTLRFKLLRPDGALLVNSVANLQLQSDNSGVRSVRRVTNDKGEITLRDQSSGRNVINVVAPGNGYARIENQPMGTTTTPPPIEVRLQSGGALRVTAREDKADGRALGGALLSINPNAKITNEDRAQGRLPSPGDGALQNLYSLRPDGSPLATQDGDGALEISDLKPGRYSVRLILPGYAPPPWQEIEVQKDEQRELQFAFEARPSNSSLRVVMQNKNGEPLADRDFNVQLRAVQGSGKGEDLAPPFPPEVGEPMLLEGNRRMRVPGLLLRRARSDADGSLTLFPVPAGRWRLSISSIGNGNNARERRAPIFQGEVEIKGDSAEIKFTESQSPK